MPESDLTQRIDTLQSYRRKLVFGLQLFSEVDEDWSKKLVEDTKR